MEADVEWVRKSGIGKRLMSNQSIRCFIDSEKKQLSSIGKVFEEVHGS